MRRGEKCLLLAVLATLMAALILLLIQSAGGGGAAEVYHVSVLRDAAESDRWKNLRAGMNQAALERNVDLRFIPRYDEGAAQSEILRQEWEGGADGVIVLPTEDLTPVLKEAPDRLAVGILGPRTARGVGDCCIAPDYAGMGRSLAEAAAELGSCTLYVEEGAGQTALELAQAVEAGLAGLGVPCERRTADPADLPPLPEHGALAAVEPELLEAICAVRGTRGRVFGVGTSDTLLRALEEGRVAAMVVQSDYDMGYLAVSQVTEQLTRGKTGDVTLETYTATGENMFRRPMADILFANY